MNKVDFSNYKFRASSLHNIMTVSFTEGVKKYLKKIWIKEVYGRERDISNKYMEKGNYAEQTDSLDIISKHYNKLFLSDDLNQLTLENEYMTGHVDIAIIPDKIIDIKSSWDMQTFGEADGKNDAYIWQGWAYLWMSGRKQFDLCYCLANSPEWSIESEVKRKMYSYQHLLGTDEYDKLYQFWQEYYEKEMKFDDIPMEERIKVFEYRFDDTKTAKVISRINECRAYLNTITKL